MRKMMLVTLGLLVAIAVGANNIPKGAVEGEDYEEKTILLWLSEGVKGNANTGMDGGGINYSGFNEIDTILNTIDTYQFEQITPLPEGPKDHPRGRWTWDDLLAAYEERGFGNNYVVRYDGAYTVNEVADMLENSDGPIRSIGCNAFGELHYDTNDPYYQIDDQLYLNGDMRGSLFVDDAWNLSKGSSSIVIAIIDTGINMVHDDLKGTGKIYKPWDFTNNEDRPLDYQGHGTNMAGLAAAWTDNGIGIAGTGFHSKIMPLQANKSDYSRYMEEEHVEQALWYAMHNGADIISMSFSGGFGGDVDNYCNSAANDFGMALFASSGNDDERDVQEPASYATVCAVGAVDETGNRIIWGQDGDWGSNYGPALELVAPAIYNGSRLRTTAKPSLYNYQDPRYWNSYGKSSGTSSACALVAGCAALIWAAAPDKTGQEIRGIMAKSALDFHPPGRDEDYGWGRVHPHRALVLLISGTPGGKNGVGTTEYESSSVLDGQTLSETVSVYPNPASGFLNINVPAGSISEVKVYDISGRVVFKETTSNDITWDLTNAEGSKVSPGVYIVTVDDGSDRVVKKAVIR